MNEGEFQRIYEQGVRVLVALGCPRERAEEIVQETLVDLVIRGKLNGAITVVNVFRRAVRYKSIDLWRKKRREDERVIEKAWLDQANKSSEDASQMAARERGLVTKIGEATLQLTGEERVAALHLIWLHNDQILQLLGLADPVFTPTSDPVELAALRKLRRELPALVGTESESRFVANVVQQALTLAVVLREAILGLPVRQQTAIRVWVDVTGNRQQAIARLGATNYDVPLSRAKSDLKAKLESHLAKIRMMGYPFTLHVIRDTL